MLRFGQLVTMVAALLAGQVNADSASKSEPVQTNAREAVDAYVKAAIAGDTERAAALAVKGSGPHSKEHISDMAELGIKNLIISSVSANEKRAIAVSETVRISDGSHEGVVVFEVMNSDGRWLVSDTDFESADDAKKQLEHFNKQNPDAKSIPVRVSKPQK